MCFVFKRFNTQSAVISLGIPVTTLWK